MLFDFCSEQTFLLPPLQREAIEHHQEITAAEDGTIRWTSLRSGTCDFLLDAHVSRSISPT